MRKDEVKAAISAFRRHTWTVLGGLILVGITLIAVSVALPERLGFWKELIKELGVVLVAVFGVSILYEILMAERHFDTFFRGLREYIERGESNAAVCARLGIVEIVPSRDIYEQKNPLAQLLAGAGPGSKIRIVGTTLFLLMTKLESIKNALQHGAQVELCSLDPEAPVNELAKWNPDLEPSDIKAAMDRFEKLRIWLDETKPPGTLELHHHRLSLFDSFASFDFGNTRLTIWDLSFGADLASKRIFVVDVGKGLGADLARRYEHILGNAALRFRYPAPVPSEPAATGEPAQR